MLDSGERSVTQQDKALHSREKRYEKMKQMINTSIAGSGTFCEERQAGGMMECDGGEEDCTGRSHKEDDIWA